MPKFRKKPVVVEAMQFNPAGGAHAVQGRGFRATEYSGETFMGYPVYTDENGPHVYLKTAGGLARADAGALQISWLRTFVLLQCSSS